MRQNSLEHIKSIEQLKSLEELDLSDNFIINIPEEIRQLSSLKRVKYVCAIYCFSHCFLL